MWNFSFVIPSILVLFVLLVYYLIRPRLPIRINRTFISILLLELLVIIADIISSYADENYQMFPLPVLMLLNMAFFVLFLARIFWFFLITTDVLRMRNAKSSLSIWMYALVFIASEIITLSSFLTGAVFSVDAAGYHRGPYYNIIYVCFFFYLALSFILLFIHRRRLRRMEFGSAVAFNLILLAGNIVRILFPTYLVMNTFCLLAVLVIFLAFENPEYYISHHYAFNIQAMREVLKERMVKDRYRILGLGIRHFTDIQSIYGPRQMDNGLRLISKYLRTTYPDLLLFYLKMGNYALMAPGDYDLDKLQAGIAARFSEPWKDDDAELFLRPKFIRVSSEAGFHDPDEIISGVMGALSEYGIGTDPSVTCINLDHSSEPLKRVAVKRALLQAVENDKVELFLQPIIDVSSDRIVAAEALARIRDEDGNLISPVVFIPIAEQNGLIDRLGEQMLRKSCAFLNSEDCPSGHLQWINVNLSPVQCMNRDLSSKFYNILKDNSVSPELIHLEITEATMDDFSILSEQMVEMINLGFRFSLDDYGSGYSNLERVKRYPFSNIKIDMELVQRHCAEPDIILPTLVRVFKEQGFSITAEGIETLEMANTMKEIGCDFLQGYYFSRPLPAGEFAKMI